MITCTRGKQLIPHGQSGIYFICQYGKNKHNQCKFVKWCIDEQSWEASTNKDGVMCPDFSTEPFVEEKILPIEPTVVKPSVSIKEVLSIESTRVLESPEVKKELAEGGLIDDKNEELAKINPDVFIPPIVNAVSEEIIEPIIIDIQKSTITPEAKAMATNTLRNATSKPKDIKLQKKKKPYDAISKIVYDSNIKADGKMANKIKSQYNKKPKE